MTLKQEGEQRRNSDMLYEKIREQLRRKEDQYSKKVEMKQQLELTLRELDMELKTVRNHGVAKSQTRLSDFTFTFHFHELEKEMATHSSILAWRIPGQGSLVGCHLWGR